MLNYEIFWLRELRGGAIGGEYGGQTMALGELPINETLAGRIHRLTPPGAAAPSLHLPFLSYRDQKNWPSEQLELPVMATDNGRITVGDDAEHQFSALLAGPVLGGRTAPMVFSDVRHFPVTDWDTTAMPMLAAHGIRMEDPSWRPRGPFELNWNIKLPACHANAWVTVPHRSEAAFLNQFRGLSTAVQRALRMWMPYQYLARAERYAKPLYAHPYMVYATLPPHPSRRKTQLTFHVLEPQRVVRSLTRLTKPLGEQLRRARVRIAASATLAPGTAAAYHADQAREIVWAMQRLPRVFGGLLALEAFVVEEFVGFAAKAHDLRGAGPHARRLVDPGLELLHSIRVRLARSQGGESFENLANLVLLAATAGLFGREDPEGILEATVSVKELDSCRQILGSSQFSYANF